MRDLARNVVGDVRFRDSVCRKGAEPSHEAAKVTKKVAVERGQCTARERELRCAIVGQDGVGVLKEGDQDEPVVDPSLRCLEQD